MRPHAAVKFLSISLSLLTLAMSASCARSQQYQSEQGAAVDDSYYYGPEAFEKKDQLTEKAKLMGQPKSRVVIFDFWNDTPVQDPSLGIYAANETRREVHLSKKALLPTEIQSQFVTRDFVDGPKVRVEQLVREGRRLGVTILVIGRISQIVFRQKGDEVGIFRSRESLATTDVEMKIFDVQSGREIAAIGKSGVASSTAGVVMEDDNLESRQFRKELVQLAIRDAVKRLMPDLVRSLDKMQWQGKIAKVIGTQVYLNSGRDSGLIKGDILRVLTQGDDIYDPESGAFLGRSQGQLKGTLEVVDFVGKDAAVAVIHTGGAATEGDVVKLY